MPIPDDFFPPNVVYFTTRKIKNGWVAERLYMKDGEMVREALGTSGGRMHTYDKFKMAVTKYWDQQYKNGGK